MATVTLLQANMLVRIAEDELTMLNGAEPSTRDEAVTYADSVIETAEDKGVFTSMLNAKLVWHVGKGRDAQVGLTADGFSAYKAIKNAERSAAVAAFQASTSPLA